MAVFSYGRCVFVIILMVSQLELTFPNVHIGVPEREVLFRQRKHHCRFPWMFTINVHSLVSAIKIGSTPFVWNSSNNIVFQFFLQYTMINCIKCMLLQNPGKHCKHIFVSLMFLVFLNKDLELLELYFFSSERSFKYYTDS